MILGPASQLSPALQAVALNGLDTFSLAARGLLVWPKEGARIGTRRRRRESYTKKYHKQQAAAWRESRRTKIGAAILHLAERAGKRGFTADQLTPAFKRENVRAQCNYMVRQGQLKVKERGETGDRNGKPTIYCAI